MASQLFHIQWRKTIILKSIKVRLEKAVLNNPVFFKLRFSKLFGIFGRNFSAIL